jgi:CRISPR-associated protein Cas5d
VREFAADFEWEPDPQAALERRASNLQKDWRTIWPEEDLGLMLYDVFDCQQRAEGFRWLTAEEIAQAQAANMSAIAPAPKRKPKRETEKAPSLYEGVCIKPQAAFFHASIKNACLDCHPERVKIITNTPAEV